MPSNEELIAKASEVLADLRTDGGRLNEIQAGRFQATLEQMAEEWRKQFAQWPWWRRWGWTVCTRLRLRRLADRFDPGMQKLISLPANMLAGDGERNKRDAEAQMRHLRGRHWRD